MTPRLKRIIFTGIGLIVFVPSCNAYLDYRQYLKVQEATSNLRQINNRMQVEAELYRAEYERLDRLYQERQAAQQGGSVRAAQ